MATFRFFLPAFLLLGACTYGTDNAAEATPAVNGHGGAPQEEADEPPLATSKSGAQTSHAGAKNSTRKSTPEVDTTEDGAAGEGSDVESAASAPAAPLSCDLDGSCVGPSCEANGLSCSVISDPNGDHCEFVGFSGATAPASCNQRVVIGTACCGICGCVPVEVYFDGTNCWQGVPQCKEDDLSARMFYPHQPSPANESFTVPDNAPGSFYLGTGGFAGAGGGVSGSGGATDVSGGSAGSSGGAGNQNAGSGGEPAHAFAGAGSGGTGGGTQAEGGSEGGAGPSSALGGAGGTHAAGSAGTP